MTARPPSRLVPILHRLLRSDNPDFSDLFGALLSYFVTFFPPRQPGEFMIHPQCALYPDTMDFDPEVDPSARDEERLLYLPFVYDDDDEATHGRAAFRDVPPAELSPVKYPYGTWKTPDFNIVKLGEGDPWTDRVVLIVELRRARAESNTEKARRELCAYLEAAAGRGIASPGMRGMLVFHSTFDVFEVVDGKAVLVRSGLAMCEEGCDDFLQNLANEHV